MNPDLPFPFKWIKSLDELSANLSLLQNIAQNSEPVIIQKIVQNSEPAIDLLHFQLLLSDKLSGWNQLPKLAVREFGSFPEYPEERQQHGIKNKHIRFIHSKHLSNNYLILQPSSNPGYLLNKYAKDLVFTREMKHTN